VGEGVQGTSERVKYLVIEKGGGKFCDECMGEEGGRGQYRVKGKT